MKKIIALLLVLVMVIGLVACGGKKDDKLTIAFVPKVEGQAWWDYVGEGVKAWAAEHPEIETIYIVTDSEPGYREMIAAFEGKNTYQLYRDYLDNFRINTGR